MTRVYWPLDTYIVMVTMIKCYYMKEYVYLFKLLRNAITLAWWSILAFQNQRLVLPSK